MSTQPQRDSSEAEGGEGRSQPATSIRNATAGLAIADNDGLLTVLRDLAATVKRLEAHVAASGSAASALGNAAPEIMKEPALHDGHSHFAVSSRKQSLETYSEVDLEEWNPFIDEITPRELARAKAQLYLPDLTEDGGNQLASALASRTYAYFTRIPEWRGQVGDSADEKILKAMWRPQLRIEKYKLSHEEFERVQFASWSPFKLIPVVGALHYGPFCETIPGKVSHADWSYYKPVFGDSNDTLIRYLSRVGGQGKNNFRGAWDFPNLESNLSLDSRTNSSLGSEYKRTFLWLPVPYPSVPPEDLYEEVRGLRQTFSERQRAMIERLLGGFWTLPPDERLALDFQQHVLKRAASFTAVMEHVEDAQKKLQRLKAAGGSLEITEADDSNHQFTYQPFDSASPAEVEEWFLTIPPKLIEVSTDGFPRLTVTGDFVDERLMNPWKRTVRIRGLAHVYTARFWKPIKRAYRVDSMRPWEPRDNMLFELHTSCSLKANERLQNDSHASILHFCWMELGTKKVEIVRHPKWKKEEIPGSDLTIGTVAASLEYFGPLSEDNYPVRKYWTILALLPTSLPHQINEIETPSQSSFWGAMLQAIKECMEVATRSWTKIATHMEQLLTSGNTKQILIEDNNFSQSTKLFWIISKIDQILPIISDATKQWVWFAQANNLYRDIEWSSPPMSQGGLPNLEELKPIMEQLQRLNDCKKEFEELRERARSLRDGIFSLTSVKEARESRILAENVKLLTYVTIFYLPLAFCTSMWAINNMFGTGTRGFAIITSLIAFSTYAVVFGLLHPPSRQSFATLLMNISDPATLRSWTYRAFKVANKSPPPAATTPEAGKAREDAEIEEHEMTPAVVHDTIIGKGKETSKSEELPEAGQKTPAKGFMARFRGSKARDNDDGLVKPAV
ncbi:hypothetical protein V8E51_011998 [Hyaloscypha variabilis]